MSERSETPTERAAEFLLTAWYAGVMGLVIMPFLAGALVWVLAGWIDELYARLTGKPNDE